LFGALSVGANTMQRTVQIPSALIMALNGLVVVFVVSSEIWRKNRQRKRLTVVEAHDDPESRVNDNPAESTGRAP